MYASDECISNRNFLQVVVSPTTNHIISFKVASYSACYLTNGDYIRYLLKKFTRENKKIAAVKMMKCFYFESALQEVKRVYYSDFFYSTQTDQKSSWKF